MHHQFACTKTMHALMGRSKNVKGLGERRSHFEGDGTDWEDNKYPESIQFIHGPEL